MSKSGKPGAVIFAKDPARVARFYEALAQLTRTYSGPDVIVLESAAQQLVVHPIPPRIARTLKITTPPKRRTQAAMKLVFPVSSIAAARAAAPQFGGALSPPQRMFEARGFRACDAHDPEGNIIQFREAAPAAAKPVTRKASRQSAVDYATVRELALALPDVVDSSTLRGIAFKARGKLLACKAVNRSVEPETLMVRVSAADRDRLIASEPHIYYVTPHYLVHESVLVRLARIDRKRLQGLLGVAWTFVTAGTGSNRKGARA